MWQVELARQTSAEQHDGGEGGWGVGGGWGTHVATVAVMQQSSIG